MSNTRRCPGPQIGQIKMARSPLGARGHRAIGRYLWGADRSGRQRFFTAALPFRGKVVTGRGAGPESDLGMDDVAPQEASDVHRGWSKSQPPGTSAAPASAG